MTKKTPETQYEPPIETQGCLSRSSAHFSNHHADLNPWMPESGSAFVGPSFPAFAGRQRKSKLASWLSNIWELMTLKFRLSVLAWQTSRAESTLRRKSRGADEHARYHDWH